MSKTVSTKARTVSHEQPGLKKHDALLKVFEDVHNHIYANEGLSAEQALEEVIKILFLKIYDEKSKGYKFQISPDEFKNLTNAKPDTIFINRFKKLQENAFSHFSGLFEEGEKIKLRSNTLAFAVHKLQNIDLLNSSNDVKGLAFQKFIHSSQRTGRGQFFTPEQVVRLCVEILDPKANETILDPACGSGGFLSSALKHVDVKNSRALQKYAKDNIFGIEINRTAAKIAKMRMILDGDGFSNIVQQDSLGDWAQINTELHKETNCKQKTYKEFFDVILTNPPFGTQGKITNSSVLKQFSLGYRWRYEDGEYIRTEELQNGQVPEILFIERSLEFLKPGGRMAIILPNGDFENSSLTYLREYIKSVADIFAVVKLPQETFIPSGTGVKTSILFLRKKSQKSNAGDKIFFSQVTKLGYSGNKNGSLLYKKDSFGNILKDKKGNPLIDENITDTVASYHNFKKGIFKRSTDNHFLVKRSDLNYERLDFEFYKPKYREIETELRKKEAKRLGDLVKIKKTKSRKLSQKELLIRYVELSDISAQYNEVMNFTEQLVHELPSRASFELSEGDIITAVAGNSIGTEGHVSAYITKEFEGYICTNGLRVMRVSETLVNPFYLLYYLKSEYFLNQVFRFRTGAAIPSLLDADLLNILILLPARKEQDRIGKIIEDGFTQRKEYQKLINSLKIS